MGKPRVTLLQLQLWAQQDRARKEALAPAPVWSPKLVEKKQKERQARARRSRNTVASTPLPFQFGKRWLRDAKNS